MRTKKKKVKIKSHENIKLKHFLFLVKFKRIYDFDSKNRTSEYCYSVFKTISILGEMLTEPSLFYSSKPFT